MKSILCSYIFLLSTSLFCQDSIPINEVYYLNDLAIAEYSNDPFTGIAVFRKKNGRLVQDWEFKNGVLLTEKLYYRREPIEVASKIYYDSILPSKKIRVDRFFGGVTESTLYNNSEEKTLVRQVRGDTLIYRCEYLNGRKNGEEYCFNEDGSATIIKYKAGKRVKN